MIGNIACKMETEKNLSFPSDANPFSVVGVTPDLLLTLVMFSSFHSSTLFVSAAFGLGKAVLVKLLILIYTLDFPNDYNFLCCNFYIKN